MFFKKKKKFMVIGIDGVPYELLRDFAQRGIMPNVKRLIERFGLKKTRVPLPEVSSVSWTSFMTGMNPGEHGIYGFMELNPDNYSYTFPSFPNLPVEPVWEVIGKRGKRSVIINLPNTYPARPMNGVLVSGFVALDLAKSVYPPLYLPVLQAMDYRVDVDTSVGKSDKKFLLRDLNETLDVRYSFCKKVEKLEKWDLFFFIITGTDRLHHFLFDAWEDPESPYHQDFLDYYRHVDGIIGELAARMEKGGIPFIILSDHGFTRIKQEVYLSQYLKEWGYLYLGENGSDRLKGITGDTTVFALDPSRLYIHLEGKYKRGGVKMQDYERLRDEVRSKFSNLEIEGEKVIREIFYKEDIYHGEYFDNAPDLVLLSNYGFDLKAGVTKDSLYGKTFFEGMHTQDNAVLIDTFGFSLEDHPYIYDIGKALQEYY